MTYDKIKISFLMTVLSISLVSVVITQSFAEEKNLSQEQERNDAINQQMSLFSKNVIGEKNPIDGINRLISETDPGLGHENHQLAVIIPISDKEYTGTLYYSASEPVQIVSLRGPLESGEEKGKLIWTSDGKINYELIMINEYSTTGQLNFVGNALAIHTFKSSSFVVDYKIKYEETNGSLQLPLNSVNDINIMIDFNFDSGTVKIDSFDVFKQVSGFGRGQPIINLQGM